MITETLTRFPCSSLGSEIESLAYEVLLLFSFLSTELNVTLSSLTTDNDVMLGSNCIHRSSTGTRLVFIAVVIQRSGKRRKEKEQCRRIECQSTKATAVLYSANPIFAEYVKPPIFCLFFQIKTSKNFLNQLKEKPATRAGKWQLLNYCI